MDAGAINPLGPALAALNLRQPNEQQASRTEVVQAVEAVNNAQLFGQNQELTFSFDQDSRRTVLRLVDRKTGEVVAQLPPQRVLRMAKSLAEQKG